MQDCTEHWEENASWVLVPLGSSEARDTKNVLATASRGSDRYTELCASSHEFSGTASKRDQFDVLTGRTWPNPESSRRAKHTREYVLMEFWQACAADRLVRRDAIHPHTFAQPKSGFSYTVTLMDEVEG